MIPKSRFSESWDERLRPGDKELLCSVVNAPKSWTLVPWRSLDESARRRLISAMRSLYELGRECERALAYSRTKNARARNGE